MNPDGDIVLSSRVRLARNYADLPFTLSSSAEQSRMCQQRTVKAIGLEAQYNESTLLNLCDLSTVDRNCLVESHLISFDLVNNSETASALIAPDESYAIMINEEDHLRIQSLAKGQQLKEAAATALEIDDALQNHLRFAFDAKLGFLTACPTNTGTGMRASLMMHLPLLTLGKQMGVVTQTIAKLGLTIRGVYGEGSEAHGNLYQVSNQATLGRTEDEIVEAVSAVAKQLIGMENTLRQKALETDKLSMEDQVSRALGLLMHAHRMSSKEFMQHWSNLRLGVVVGILSVPLDTVDTLLTEAQDAHVMKWIGEEQKDEKLDAARSKRIRGILASF